MTPSALYPIMYKMVEYIIVKNLLKAAGDEIRRVVTESEGELPSEIFAPYDLDQKGRVWGVLINRQTEEINSAVQSAGRRPRKTPRLRFKRTPLGRRLDMGIGVVPSAQRSLSELFILKDSGRESLPSLHYMPPEAIRRGDILKQGN